MLKNQYNPKKVVILKIHSIVMLKLETSDENFDLSMLLDIADGSNEFIVETIELFLKQTPELMDEIEGALLAKDLKLAAASAHKLKPNLGFFGMDNAQTLMQQIEGLAKAGNDVPEILARFSELTAIVKPTLLKLEQIMIAKATEILKR